MTGLADKLAAALNTASSRAPREYEDAIIACDEAWSGVEGALMNGPRYAHLQQRALSEFRVAYARKLSAWRRAASLTTNGEG